MEFDIVSLVQNIGFPIAISLYFIIKTEKTIQNNTTALGEIKTVMLSCKKN